MAHVPIKQKIIADISKILETAPLTSNEHTALLCRLANHALRVRKEAMKMKDEEHRIRSKHLILQLSREEA